MERCKELESCVHDLEQENLELNQKMKMDSKTLATLRQVSNNNRMLIIALNSYLITVHVFTLPLSLACEKLLPQLPFVKSPLCTKFNFC